MRALGMVLVFAPDLDVARDFYERVLGLRLETADDSYLSFTGPDFSLAVFACDDSTRPEGHAQRPGVAVAFAVASLEESVAELVARGVRFLHEEPVEGPFGRYVAFTDPFGTVHELIESG